jgi:tetratricopeptide (TPR) repeat protein
VSAHATAEPQDWIARLADLGEDKSRKEFWRRYGRQVDPPLIESLCTEVSRLVWSDVEKATRLAASTRWLAEALDDDRCRALTARAAANALHSAGENDQAQELYELALERFHCIGERREEAITRSCALLNLAYLGDYARVAQWEEAARETFAGLSDHLRLAILSHNFANILYRQDRWEDALGRYQLAHKEFVRLRRPQDAAVCLRNIGVCHISLHNFAEAFAVYERTRAYCLEEGLDRLVLQVDYNIAYLFYLRGEYTRAVQLYRDVRRRCEAEGDEYHKALCDLDQAEIFLELNMIEDSATLARAACESFEELRLPYEWAKALTNGAVAHSRQGKGALALEELARARAMFLQEGNRLWPALVDFYRAVILYRENRHGDAIRLAEAAQEVFLRSSLAPKAAMCELLLAEIYLARREPRKAREVCDVALARLADLELPALEHQAYLVLGQIEEAFGDRTRALDAYRQSHSWIEKLCSQLQSEELKIAFLGERRRVYESLVWLTMQDPQIPGRERLAFDYIEQARSRSLSDLMSFRVHDLPPTRAAHGDLARRIRALREELNWYYRQVDLQQMRGGERSLEEVRKIRRNVRAKEDQLLRALHELRTADQELSSLQSGGGIDLETVRSSLPEAAVMAEYFIARGTIFCCVVGRREIAVVPLGTVARTLEIHRRLQFQLSRSMLGREQIGDGLALIEEATQAHLRDLYGELVAPLEPLLAADHLVVVPYGFLHYVPFHALFDGRRYLIDRFSISYAPSAGVFHLCRTKPTAWRQQSLVLAVADERAPLILEEARAVADALPDVTLLLGEDASEEALRSRGADSRFVHIATHGLFRRDNPMFSAIQLGTFRLSLFDLYSLRLKAEMVVLSGCGTGLNAVLGADELVGLTRGFLYAGAQSVVVSLWDVHDASTALFMRRFYLHLARGTPRARALRRTMTELRRSYPNPYHWAPFVLVGNPG